MGPRDVSYALRNNTPCIVLLVCCLALTASLASLGCGADPGSRPSRRPQDAPPVGALSGHGNRTAAHHSNEQIVRHQLQQQAVEAAANGLGAVERPRREQLMALFPPRGPPCRGIAFDRFQESEADRIDWRVSHDLCRLRPHAERSFLATHARRFRTRRYRTARNSVYASEQRETDRPAHKLYSV